MKGPFWEKVKKTTEKGLGVRSKKYVQKKAPVVVGLERLMPSTV